MISTASDSHISQLFCSRFQRWDVQSSESSVTIHDSLLSFIQLYDIPHMNDQLKPALIATLQKMVNDDNTVVISLPDILVVDTNQQSDLLDHESLLQIDLNDISLFDESPVPKNDHQNRQFKVAQENSYSLYAFSIYRGNGISGHYAARTYSSILNKWIEFDCEKASTILSPFDSNSTGWVPKLLFYRRSDAPWNIDEICHITDTIKNINRPMTPVGVQCNPTETPITEKFRSPFKFRVALSPPNGGNHGNYNISKRPITDKAIPSRKNDLLPLSCPCYACSFKTASRRALDCHIRQNHPHEKHYHCSVHGCGFSAVTHEYLQNHLRRYHSTKTYTCVTCEFTTRYKANLVSHEKSHGYDGKFKCSFCNYSSDTLSRVRHHESNDHKEIQTDSSFLSDSSNDSHPDGRIETVNQASPYPAISQVTRTCADQGGPPFLQRPSLKIQRKITI